MWKSFDVIFRTPIKYHRTFLDVEIISHQQVRTTFVLKRRNPPFLHKKGDPPKTLRSRHYVYDLVKQTHLERQPDIEVILTSFVKGLGNVGDKVSVRPNYAYNSLLLPRLAIYSSPENQEKYKEPASNKEEIKYSSPNVAYTITSLSQMLLSVVMNKDVPWTLKPWHVKTSFRKSGFIVPEDAIELPEKTIKGPDMSIQDKEFFVVVTVNNQEKVNVRCRIHHWSSNVTERIPYVPYFFYQPSEPIFAEQAPILEEMPRKPIKAVK